MLCSPFDVAGISFIGLVSVQTILYWMFFNVSDYLLLLCLASSWSIGTGSIVLCLSNQINLSISFCYGYEMSACNWLPQWAFPRLSGSTNVKAGCMKTSEKREWGMMGMENRERDSVQNPVSKICKSSRKWQIFYISKMAEFCDDEAPLSSLKNISLRRLPKRLIVDNRQRKDSGGSAHFLFWEILNLNLTFVVCRIIIW